MEILIVDDEAIERKGLIMLLKREKIDAQIREASNGKQALDKLEEKPADLMLTDIKMPFMDGLELTDICSKKYPDMRMVIFSGYREFEYARKAMNSGVTNYILKPVDPSEFHETIEKVTKEMNEAAIEHENRDRRSDFILEHVLLELLNGKDLETLDPSIRKMIPDGFAEDITVMALLSFDHDFFGIKSVNFSDEMKKKTGFDFWCVNIDPSSCIFVFNEEIEDRKALGEKLSEAVRRLYDETAYVAVSESLPGGHSNLKALGRTYDSLEALMENRFYLSDDHVFLEGDETEPADINDIDSDVLMKQIKQDINVRDMVGLRVHYEKLCDKYKNNTGFSQVYVKFVFSNLMKEIYDNLPKEDQGSLSADVDRLYRTTDFTEVMNILDRGISLLEKNFDLNPQTSHREIETVKKYIYEHYNEELSTELLAEKVYMAPSYLSHVFKKETGQNLSKFIKALRMEKAKQMLEETHNKIVNISYAVGYPNVSYFCRSFRAYYGVSPQQYRTEEGKS